MASYLSSLFTSSGESSFFSPLSSPFASPMVMRKPANTPPDSATDEVCATAGVCEPLHKHSSKHASPLINIPTAEVISWSAPSTPTTSSSLLSPPSSSGTFDSVFDIRSRELTVRRQDSTVSADHANSRIRRVRVDLERNVEHMTYTRGEYDRSGGRAAKLSQREKADIRAELISFKLNEMEVHPDSKQYLNLYNRARRAVNLATLEVVRQREEEENQSTYNEIFSNVVDRETLIVQVQFADLSVAHENPRQGGGILKESIAV
eukprot:comp63623_c0_seq1/m.47954 comp63623_c0_seq1/g.47954  ORF comp63623_c0_seq1/g.47954 comp63623_c0_seq1/m.47954 type:complete len:263 (-) comp63623_c0_seq1:551-1339(-)